MHIHLQQAFFLMGWALRTTVVSLSLSSRSINTLNKHTAACQHAAAPRRHFNLDVSASPGQVCQGLRHVPACVGADLGEHHLVFLGWGVEEDVRSGAWSTAPPSTGSELTWASFSASLTGTSRHSSMSILFPRSKMGIPSPAASWGGKQKVQHVTNKLQQRPEMLKRPGSKVRPGR